MPAMPHATTGKIVRSIHYDDGTVDMVARMDDGRLVKFVNVQTGRMELLGDCDTDSSTTLDLKPNPELKETPMSDLKYSSFPATPVSAQTVADFLPPGLYQGVVKRMLKETIKFKVVDEDNSKDPADG